MSLSLFTMPLLVLLAAQGPIRRFLQQFRLIPTWIAGILLLQTQSESLSILVATMPDMRLLLRTNELPAAVPDYVLQQIGGTAFSRHSPIIAAKSLRETT